jgi:hypothetical protein
MLGQAFIMLAIVTLLAGVAIDQVAALARASINAGAARVVDAAVDDAAASYEQQIAAAIASAATNATPPPGSVATAPPGAIAALTNSVVLPSPQPFDGVSGRYGIHAFVQTTTSSAPQCAGARGTGEASDVAVDMQCSPWVQESRLSAQIVVQISPAGAAPGAAVLLQRVENVTFRLFAAAPYVAIAGRQDAAAIASNAHDPSVVDVGSGAPHEYDTAGRGGAPLAADASSRVVNDGPGDTVVHVIYNCTNPSGGACPQMPAPPDLSGVQPSSPWKNGNANKNPGGPVGTQ